MAEAMDAYGMEIRKARKQHKCYECGIEIKTGEHYNYHHGVFDGAGHSYKVCLKCDEIRREIESGLNLRYDELIGFGELAEYCCECGIDIVTGLDREGSDEKSRL